MDDTRIREIAEEVWSRLLEVDITDATDFFDVGGHSFLGMRIVAALDELLPAPTSITLLFDHPRFGDFVAALTAELRAPSTSGT